MSNILVKETLKTVCNALSAAGHSDEDIFNALNDITFDYFSKLEDVDDIFEWLEKEENE